MAKYLLNFVCLITCMHGILSQDDAQDIAALACESEDSIYEFNGAQGIIQTAYFPDYYKNYETCTWYINPTNVDFGKQVYLEVDTFDTEDMYDHVRIYRGQSTDEDDQIFQLDGFYPFGYYIPTSETRVTLKFESDGSFNFTGVNLTYFLEDTTPAQLTTQLACNSSFQPANLTSTNSTVIESLNYPLNYEAGVRCLWTLMPEDPPGGGFYLSVINFHTGSDILNIYFSDNVDGDADATWTETLQQGHSLYSESEVVSLEFQPGGTEPGFQIVYYLSDEACQSASAREVPVDGYGELISPGYPYDIPEQVSCRWLLRAPDDQKVLLYSLEFSLNGDGEDCNNEYLEILDGEEGDAISIGKFCGNTTFGNFPSSSSAIQLYLTTHENDDDTSSPFVPFGFKLSFEPY